MAKPPHKYFAKLPPPSKVRKDDFESTNFVAKSPTKYKSCTVSKNESIDDKELDGGFVVIKASEGPIIVTFGGIQLVTGILMIAFGILSMLHEASMSTVGAGLWGGAMGAANGFVGIIAGFKGCYQTSDRISPLAITVYLALCLVAIGVTNLALVLTATGLLRDSRRPDYFLPLKQEDYRFVEIDDSNRANWAPVLANMGLFIITAVECLATVVAAFRCYSYVCRCRRKKRNSVGDPSSSPNHLNYSYDSPDVTTASYCSSSPSKQKLVRCWLGQQQQQERRQKQQQQHHYQHRPSARKARPSVPFVSPYGPAGLTPTYYTIDGKRIYPSGSFVSYADHNYMIPNMVDPYYPQQWPRVSVFPQYTTLSQPKHQGKDGREMHHSRNKQPQQQQQQQKHPHPQSQLQHSHSQKHFLSNERRRKKSDSTIITEEGMDKTYTGLDREIAEEFISIAMEPKR